MYKLIAKECTASTQKEEFPLGISGQKDQGLDTIGTSDYDDIIYHNSKEKLVYENICFGNVSERNGDLMGLGVGLPKIKLRTKSRSSGRPCAWHLRTT